MSAGSLQTDARRLVKTTTPGIFKRGDRYVAVYRDDDGRQCKKSCATLAEARTFKSTVTADKARGEFVVQSRVTVADYFDDWLPAYTGRTSRGIREQTKHQYGEQMRLHVLPTLGRRRLADLGPRDVKRLAADLRASGSPRTASGSRSHRCGRCSRTRSRTRSSGGTRRLASALRSRATRRPTVVRRR